MSQPDAPNSESEQKLDGCGYGCVALCMMPIVIFFLWTSGCILKTTNDLVDEIERAQARDVRRY